MPFDKLKLSTMTASEEYVSIDEIAIRLGVTERTVERLTERFRKKLKASRRKRGRKIEYRWSDVLRCAKIYTGIEAVLSGASRTAHAKQRVQELEAEIERLRQEIDVLQSEKEVQEI